jgi:hypothetical protein
VAGLRDIVREMADQIRTVVDSSAFPIQVEPQYVLTPTPLTIDIYPGEVSRDSATAAFGDDGGYLLTVRARINTPDYDSAYDVLLSLWDDDDPLCLALALLDAPTLNGYASSMDVRDPTGLRAYETPSGEGAYLGFQFTALVLPAHS